MNRPLVLTVKTAVVGLVVAAILTFIALPRLPLAIRGALALAGIGLCVFVARKIGVTLVTSFYPVHAAKPSRAARLSEAILIATGGSFTLLFVLSEMGLHVPDFSHPRDRVYAGCLIGASLLTMAAVVLALRGRGSIAIAALGVCVAGGAALAGWAMPRDLNHLLRAGIPRYVLGFQNDFDLPADVWVNGVHLGRTPLVIPVEMFGQRVPKSFSRPNDEDLVEVSDYAPGHRHDREEHRLIAFELKDPPVSGWHSTTSNKYVAQFRLADEVGYGRYSGGGDGLGNDGWTGHVRFDMTFPKVNQRLETLLDQVRLADYRADRNWFTAVESFGRLGRTRIRDAAEGESGLMQVWDEWAQWRYQLNEAHDASTAWLKLMEICREADEQDRYFTADLAGRAVELLVPLLDADQLSQHAIKRIRSISAIGYTHDRKYGRIQFGSGDGLISHQSSYYDRLSGNARTTPADFAVAHAVWLKNEQLSRAGGPPNIIQREVGAALICWRYPWDNALRMADAIDWPGMDTFLLRQDWSASVKFGRNSWWENRMMVGPSEVNKWLYLLAHRSSPAAAAFRRQHRRELVELADELLNNAFNREIPEFLFHDISSGTRSLAAEYWQRFRAGLSRIHEPNQLAKMWEYLVRMEPVSTSLMYAESWRDATRPEIWIHQAIPVLRELPLARRQEVVDAVLAEVGGESTQSQRPIDEPRRQQLQNALHSCLTDPDEAEAEAERVLAMVTGAEAPKFRKTTGDWLEFSRPDHPVVTRLAASPDADVRALALRAIRAHPIARHRELLRQLLADTDSQVRSGAEDVRAMLEHLATRPAGEFALSVKGR